MALEIGLVFDQQGKTIHWFGGHSGVSIPDSDALWDVLWENRHRLGGVAHTHPWIGAARPSHTDITTFSAIEKGLGKHLLWPVVTFDDILYVVRNPLYTEGEAMWTSVGQLTFEIEGLEELRRRSGSTLVPAP